MSYTPRILVFAGSTRTGSFNKQLALAAHRLVQEAGAEATYLDLRDLQLPLYDGDLEAAEGLPAGARRFKELLKSHDGFLIASPEYNSSVTAVLKNAIDWASRSEGDEGSLVAFSGKVAALVSASPGALGGLRGLVHLRSILGNIQVLVIPQQLAVSQAHAAFGEDGNLVDARQQSTLTAIAKSLVETTARLNK